MLLAGIVAAGLRFPSAPAESWDVVHAFRFDEAECRTLRGSRETAAFVCPESLAETVTIDEVARRFRLELELVCRANQLAPDCGAREVAPGERLVLPLGRGASRSTDPSPQEPAE